MSAGWAAASAAALLAFIVVGCAQGAAPARSTPRLDSGTAVEPYLPLQDNTVFSYETQRESSGETGILILRVRRPRADRAELIGGRVERIDYFQDGIQYATGGYLLKPPLTVGATWRGRSGTVRVVSTDRTIEVPAGKFSGCVETLEESGAAGSRVTTVFCPKIGIVLLDVQGQMNGDSDREVARLRYYGPAVNLELGAPIEPSR